MSNDQIIPKNPADEIQQRLPREYLRFRRKMGVIKNFIGWIMTSGVFFGTIIVIYFPLFPVGLQGSRDFVSFYASVLLFVGFCVVPMFTCIGLHRWWLGKYCRSYEWNLTNDALHIREGVFTRTDTKIPLAIIKGAGIAQGYWEWKNGWFKVTIATKKMTEDTKDPRPRIAARILGVNEPRVVQELIVNAAREFNKHALQQFAQ